MNRNVKKIVCDRLKEILEVKRDELSRECSRLTAALPNPLVEYGKLLERNNKERTAYMEYVQRRLSKYVNAHPSVSCSFYGFEAGLAAHRYSKDQIKMLDYPPKFIEITVDYWDKADAISARYIKARTALDKLFKDKELEVLLCDVPEDVMKLIKGLETMKVAM